MAPRLGRRYPLRNRFDTRLARESANAHRVGMDLDALLYHYFGSSDLDGIDPATLDAGKDRVRIAFGTEREPGRRFALWALLHALGDAPRPADAFDNPRERQAAEMYARAAAYTDRPDD